MFLVLTKLNVSVRPWSFFLTGIMSLTRILQALYVKSIIKLCFSSFVHTQNAPKNQGKDVKSVNFRKDFRKEFSQGFVRFVRQIGLKTLLLWKTVLIISICDISLFVLYYRLYFILFIIVSYIYIYFYIYTVK